LGTTRPTVTWIVCGGVAGANAKAAARMLISSSVNTSETLEREPRIYYSSKSEQVLHLS
jgi:hypothetical protein